MAREAAISATSGEKSSRRWLTLTPAPMTRDCTAPVSPSRAISVRMPQSFLPPSTRSLVHLIPTWAPETRSTARATATAAIPVAPRRAWGGSWGRSSTER